MMDWLCIRGVWLNRQADLMLQGGSGLCKLFLAVSINCDRGGNCDDIRHPQAR